MLENFQIMMKSFSALVLFILISMTTVQAQNSTSTPAALANPGGFFIKGGVNFSNISTQNNGSYNNANTLTTFNVGVLADVPLADVLSLQPGVVLTGKGSKASGSFAGVTSTTTFNPLYIEVPVNVVVKLPLSNDSRIFFGAGPYGAVGVGGKWKTTVDAGTNSLNSNDKIKFGSSNGDDLKTFDYGLNGLAGVEISRLMLGVNYDLGLSKIFPNQTNNSANDKNKYRVFSINVGVRF